MLLPLVSLVVVTLAYPQTHTEGTNLLRLHSKSPTVTAKQEDIRTNVTESIKDDGRETCICVAKFLCDEQDIMEEPEITSENRFCGRFYDVCCNIRPETLTTPVPKVTRGCGYRNPQGIEFSSRNSGETPWVVALMVGNTTVGAGALVHPRVVLTAAHVADKFSNETLVIRVGEFHTRTDKQRFKPQDRLVEKVKIHKDFVKTSLKNDIALLHLQAPMELADHINVICLPDQDESFEQSRECIVNGWEKDRSGALTLKRIEADIISSESCNDKLKRTRLSKWFRLDKSFLCAEEKKGYTCKGDAGAPLVCPGAEYYKVCGLVAWGIGCGDDIPAVYTRVPMFREWVDDTMRGWGFGAEEWV